MIKKSLPVFAALLLCLNLSSSLAEDMLDNRSFSGEIGNVGKQTGQADNFSFQNGKFESTLCRGFGYGKGDYKATVTDGRIQFEAQSTSADGGVMAWKGTVIGNSIEGAVVTTENNKEKKEVVRTESWFKGTRK